MKGRVYYWQGMGMALCLMASARGAAPAGGAGAAAGGTVKFTVGEPIQDMLNAIAAKYGAVVMAPKMSATVMKAGELPATLEESVALVRENLESQDLGVIRTMSSPPHPLVILRVASLKEAKEAERQEAPVTAGVDPAKIDVKNPGQMVTHLLPVTHADLLERLQRTVGEDKELKVEVVGTAEAGYTLVVRGPAGKVKQAVTNVVMIDKPADDQRAVRQMKLSNLDAVTTAQTLNATFAREGKGNMRAVADARTNILIVTGPENQVVDTMVTIIGMDLGARGSGGRGGAGNGGADPGVPAASDPEKPGASKGGALDESGRSGENV